MPKRLMLAAAAVLVLSAPTSALAGTRGMTVKVPKSVTEGTTFTASYTGDTGPGDQAGGGFIITARLYKGGGSCPANAAINAKRDTTASIAGGNLFAAGAFSSGDRIKVYAPGKWRVCGYVTTNTADIAYELLYSGKLTVKKRKSFKVSKLPTAKAGTYTATAADITGGNPDASVTLTIQGGNVVSAAATGIPTVSCFPGFPTATPVTPAATSVAMSIGRNPVYNTFLGAFDAPPNQDFHVDGGAISNSTVMGTVSAQSSDGSCTGAFAFKAKRAK